MGGLGSFVDLGVVIVECHLGANITDLKGVPVPAPQYGLIFFLSVGTLRHSYCRLRCDII